MALAQALAQQNTVAQIPEPTPQQVPVMEDTRSAEQEVVYNNAGQSPAGGTTGNVISRLANGSSFWQGVVLIAFLVVLVYVGSGLHHYSKEKSRKEE